MPIDPMNHNPASGIFSTRAPSKRRRGSRDVVPREPREKDSSGPAVSYAEKDAKHYFLLDLYGPQEEFKRDRR